MKRNISLLCILMILAIPVAAGAMPSSLSRESSSVVLHKNESVQVVSYKAYLKVDSDVTKTNAALVLLNTSPDTEAKFTMGMPSSIDQGTTKLSDLEVSMDGEYPKIVRRKDRTKSEEAFARDIPDHWYTWKITLSPNEHRVINLSWSTENQKEENGTTSIGIPLEYLKSWNGTAQNVEIVINMENQDMQAPCAFAPNPLPQEYDGRGRLTWRYRNSEVPESIHFTFRSVEQAAAEYILTQGSGDSAIQSIGKTFLNQSYDETIHSIDEYLNAQGDAPLKNELLFLKALSCQGLYQEDQMSAIYDQLKKQPLFGEMESTMKSRMIFDQYHYKKDSPADNTELSKYLNQSKNLVADNELFQDWIKEELSTLSYSAVKPKPSAKAAPPKTEPASADRNEETLIKSVSVGGMDIPVELIFLAVLLILLLLIIHIIRKKRRRRKDYIFR